jgi:hypothetical protein
MNELGKLVQVDLRKVWEHEARDFSAWLVKPENLSLLSEQLGIEIEPVDTEASIGRFRIDILAKEAMTGANIIIENQLEQTNHDHLGKVITYAAGLDAKYLIWIVKDVLPEHLKAIEWLNEHLDDEISCFLIRIEVWQIGDSKPAPRFEIVGIKNDWAATLKKSATNEEASSTKLGQLEFWQHLHEYIRNKDKFIRLQTPKPRRYLNFAIGDSIAQVVLVIAPRRSQLTCELYINSDKELLAYLKSRESDIVAKMGPVEWFDANVASGVFQDLKVDDVFDSTKFDDYSEWCYQKVLLFKEALVPLIKDYRQLSN